ncbi:MAG: hypothetical protein ACHRXM_15220, partial [Isosphaerales bacterium]
LLMLAVIVARFRRGDEKAFWFGFAVFGWGFFLLGLGPWMNPLGDSEERLSGNLNPSLLTSRLVLFLVPRLRKETEDLEAIQKITVNTVGIAHLLITLTLAICGGLIAALVRRRRGKITAVKALSILAGLAVITAFASSSYSARQPAPFFPLLDEKKDLSPFDELWYSKHLYAMAEPSLWKLSQRDRDATVYRLLWLPSFHHPVSVRIARTAEGAKLHVRVLDGKGGYEPGRVAIDRNITLADEERKNLDRYLERASFWTMSTRPADDGGVEDGDQLIVEGIRGGTYHVVDRQMPDPAYEKLCRHMLDLTGLDVQKAWDGYHSSE